MEPTPQPSPPPHTGRPIAGCLNCGTALMGPFCHVCGQERGSRVVPLRQLAHDFLGDFFSFDGRFARTLVPLFTRPGALTVAFAQGRRAPFVPPMRLYVFSSFLLFLVLALLRVGDASFFNPTGADPAPAAPPGVVTTADSVAVQAGLDSLRAYLEPADSTRPGNLYRRQKERIFGNREAFKAQLAGRVPLLLFLLVPVFAAELKLLYLRRHRYYVEHLVFALHTHAWVFLLIAFTTLLARLWSGVWLMALAAVPVYVFMALRRVHGQSRLKTGLKVGLLFWLHAWVGFFATLLYLVVQVLVF